MEGGGGQNSPFISEEFRQSSKVEPRFGQIPIIKNPEIAKIEKPPPPVMFSDLSLMM